MHFLEYIFDPLSKLRLINIRINNIKVKYENSRILILYYINIKIN